MLLKCFCTRFQAEKECLKLRENAKAGSCTYGLTLEQLFCACGRHHCGECEKASSLNFFAVPHVGLCKTMVPAKLSMDASLAVEQED